MEIQRKLVDLEDRKKEFENNRYQRRPQSREEIENKIFGSLEKKLDMDTRNIGIERVQHIGEISNDKEWAKVV